jgi:hypothetical protein
VNLPGRAPVEIRTSLPPEEALAQLARTFDKPLAQREVFGTVSRWTVYGEIEGQRVRVDTQGPFGGWSSGNGIGAWQPVFNGVVEPTSDGSVLRGWVGMRTSFVAIVSFALVWFGSVLIGLLPPLVEHLATGTFDRAAQLAFFMFLLVVVPAVGIAFVWRSGRREAEALVTRLAGSVVGVVPPTTRDLGRSPV